MLSKILHKLPKITDPNLLVSGEKMDDAGVYKISNDMALVQTLDFFTPMVDDPYLFGQIAAVNSLNDVYAMGGRPLTAMNIVCFPNCLDVQVLGHILEGGYSKIQEAGAVLLGGHSVEDNEPKYGLSVTGIIHPDQIITNGGAQPGQTIVLTKPIGTGIISTGIKGKVADDRSIDAAVSAMTALNDKASKAMVECGAAACTDITGFGLLGHMLEMAEASNVTIEMELSLVPILHGAHELAKMGIVPAGARSNLKFVENKVKWQKNVDDTYRDILADPQTAGGLLIAIDNKRADELINLLKEYGVKGYIIGRTAQFTGKNIIVEGK